MRREEIRYQFEERRAGNPYGIGGGFGMMDYAFETVAADEGFFVGKTTGHREAILRRAAEGWHYAGWIPTQQMNGSILEIDLVFEREQGGQA